MEVDWIVLALGAFGAVGIVTGLAIIVVTAIQGRPLDLSGVGHIPGPRPGKEGRDAG